MASKGVNKVIIIGNVGKEPETKTFQNGGSIVNVTVATSESWKDKISGENTERTEWHKIVFNGKLAEIASQYIKKGSKIYIEGKLKTRKWQDKEGQDRYTTEIVADNVQFLDTRKESAPQEKSAGFSASSNQIPFGGFDDDIPF